MKLVKIFGLVGLSSGEDYRSDERNNLPGPFGRLARRNVPCQWAGWCDWSPCGASCGKNAVQSRTRECICDGLIDPASRGCIGEAHEGKPCGDIECPEEKDECPTGDWMPWSECSATCGDGSRSRSRDCVCPDGKSPDECGGCGDELLSEDEPCNNGVCPSACVWDGWSTWSECTASCGPGNQIRKRDFPPGCDDYSFKTGHGDMPPPEPIVSYIDFSVNDDSDYWPAAESYDASGDLPWTGGEFDYSSGDGPSLRPDYNVYPDGSEVPMPDENYPDIDETFDINVSSEIEVVTTSSPQSEDVDPIIFDSGSIFTTANYYYGGESETVAPIVEEPEPNETTSTTSTTRTSTATTTTTEKTTTSTTSSASTTTTPKKTTASVIEEIDADETEAEDTFSSSSSSSISSSSESSTSESSQPCECSEESSSPCSCVSEFIEEPDPDHSAPILDCDILSGERCAPETTTEIPEIETTPEDLEATTESSPDYYTATEVICNTTEIEEIDETTMELAIETTPEPLIETTTKESGPDFITVLDCNTTESPENPVTTPMTIETTMAEIIETTVAEIAETTQPKLETSFVTELDCDTIEPTEAPDCNCEDDECPNVCPPECDSPQCAPKPNCDNSPNCNPEDIESTTEPDNGLTFELTTAEPAGPYVTYFDNQGPLVTTEGPPGPPEEPELCVEPWSEWSPCDCIEERSMRSRERICFCELCLEDLFEEEICTEPCEEAKPTTASPKPSTSEPNPTTSKLEPIRTTISMGTSITTNRMELPVNSDLPTLAKLTTSHTISTSTEDDSTTRQSTNHETWTANSNDDLYDASTWPSSSPETDALSTVTEYWTESGLTSSPDTTFAPLMETTMTHLDELEATTKIATTPSPSFSLETTQKTILEKTDRWSTEAITDDEEDDCNCDDFEASGDDESGSGYKSCCKISPTILPREPIIEESTTELDVFAETTEGFQTESPFVEITTQDISFTTQSALETSLPNESTTEEYITVWDCNTTESADDQTPFSDETTAYSTTELEFSSGQSIEQTTIPVQTSSTIQPTGNCDGKCGEEIPLPKTTEIPDCQECETEDEDSEPKTSSAEVTTSITTTDSDCNCDEEENCIHSNSSSSSTSSQKISTTTVTTSTTTRSTKSESTTSTSASTKSPLTEKSKDCECTEKHGCDAAPDKTSTSTVHSKEETSTTTSTKQMSTTTSATISTPNISEDCDCKNNSDCECQPVTTTDYIEITTTPTEESSTTTTTSTTTSSTTTSSTTTTSTTTTTKPELISIPGRPDIIIGNNNNEQVTSGSNLISPPLEPTASAPEACDKGNWEPWGPCSTTCGEEGTRTRKRPCGSGCDADKEDERPEETGPCDASDCAPCPKKECDCSVPACDRPKDCECPDELKEMCAWTEWSGFCGCSASCDEGIQARTRKCFCGDEEAIGLPQPGCEGEPQEEVPCNEGPCDPTENCLENGLVCSPGQWSDFGPCDAPCGETRQQTRERSCECPEGIPADHEECGCGETSECKTCRGECDNNPEPWTSWSPCECEMENPERSRFRECDSCDDSVPLVETETCPPGECVPEMSLDDCLGDWEDWGPCDAVCGVGTRTRERPCKCGQPGCPGCEETSEEEECIGDQEPCEAGPWSEFGECDAKCDEPGQQFRNRECFCPPGIDEDHPDCGCESTSECKSCIGNCNCPTDGSGYRERVRYNPCDPNPDAPPEVLTEPCAEEPIMCVASEWSEFGECDAECDGFGQMTRSRECACPEGADEDDEECGCGELTECKSCQGKPCNCWGEWAPWSPCDGPCGGGVRTRESQNICDEGVEPKIEEEECEEIICTPGEWSEWTECDAEPGEYGQKFRERDCTCPPGGDELNPDCGCGDLKECLSCKGESLCEWSPWSEPKAPCTATCGGGTQPRDRTCNERPKSFESPEAPRRTCEKIPDIEEGCPGAFTEQTPCSFDACPPKCEFGEWSCWSECSATCGGGKMSRERPCNCPEGVPESECENNGQCDGEPIEEQDCNTDVTCPPDCEFGDDWAPWGPCTTTCGPGSRQREKECDCKSSDSCDGCEVPEGSNPDDFLETGDCPNAPCTCWGDWAPWSECPNSCGTDTRTRERPCICEDEDCNEEDNIEQELCPGDSCMWSCWSEWTECLGGVNSLEGPPCGESTKKRTRTCDCPPGVDESECGCEGPSEEEEPCDLGSCEDLCYTQWSPWSPCGECGGLSTRERECMCDAEWCQFTTTEMNECPDFKCKPGQWSDWSPCTATCGPRAIMTKTRDCNCPEGANPIACGCDQDLVKERKCPNVPDECPPECTDWCNWSECECKTGQQTRVRECDENVCQGREETPECQEREDRTCPDGSCDKPNCGWTEWCSWSDCDVTCGSGGTRVRTRNCDCEDECSQDERDEGCPGDAIEEEPCVEVPPCDFDSGVDSECGEDEDCNGDSECTGPDCSGTTNYDGNPPLEPEPECEETLGPWCDWSDCMEYEDDNPYFEGQCFQSRSRECLCGDCADEEVIETEPCPCPDDDAPECENDDCAPEGSGSEPCPDDNCPEGSGEAPEEAPEDCDDEKEAPPVDECPEGSPCNDKEECPEGSPCDENDECPEGSPCDDDDEAPELPSGDGGDEECDENTGCDEGSGAPPIIDLDTTPLPPPTTTSAEETEPPCDNNDNGGCSWNEWCGWSECVGGGPPDCFRVRVRTCDCPTPCPGEDIEKEPCPCPECSSDNPDRPPDCDADCTPGPATEVTPEDLTTPQIQEYLSTVPPTMLTTAPPTDDFDGSGDCDDDDCTMEGSSDIPCRDCPDCEGCVPSSGDGSDNECPSTPWAEWTECSCENNQRERFRGCVEDGLCTCPDIVESEPCPEEELTECTCEFDEWCPWSECTKPCNGGTMTRSRNCPCGNCDGDAYEVQDCNTQCCPDLPEAPEDGRYCSSRINYRTKEPAVCCDERNDDCTFDMGDGRKCFCDNYCAREESDCCPDYAETCLDIPPTALPPPVYTTREPSLDLDSPTGPCYDSTGTRIVPISTETRENCNSCRCRLQPDGSLRFSCDTNICLIDPELIATVNAADRQDATSWTAGNYSFFWGKTLNHGYRNYLGTAPPSDFAEACETLEVTELPSSFDFTSPADHVIPQNLHQEDCGASFAFSFFNLVNFKLLSTNQRAFHGDVLEVLKSCGNGCIPGDVLDIHHAAKTGFWPDSDGSNVCPMFDSCVRVSGAKRLACVDDIKREVLTVGPVIAYLNVSRDFFVYQDGIYSPTVQTPATQTNSQLHSVVLVGWGEGYWLARNSWGDDSRDNESAWGMCLNDGGRERCGFVKLASGIIDSSYVVTIPVDTSDCDHSGEYNES
ncbi:Oidioi.mRNA.OKI2018_I69.chr2.g4444.t2.cds [Oikopleura dioica]|uniref:Oidioi.mRNA.OKI2018_I69.chr2.g4444.t2.cds n=1 Tax=Oikopleura dioica TaxID=34765 RepID=A0ABN7SWY6_OIKDI|nr:Oidioi.mRNA.OKI2018_I69.chr2.g4444.t2.cds [Oikopleura dioica]